VARLLIVIVVGVVFAVVAAVVTSYALAGRANGTPSKASLYQYGSR
jgi:K+-transporting ATPase c subunit